MRNSQQKIFNFFLFFVLFSTSIFAQTNIFVSTTGNGITGNGSISNPYLTITKAATVAQPGDFVLVRGGTYRNSDFATADIWNGTNAVTITANGSAGNYITFMPYSNEHVIIEFNGTYAVFIQNASYIKFKGFDVKGLGDVIDPADALAAWGLYKDLNGDVQDLAADLGIDPADLTIRGTTIPKPSDPTAIKPTLYNSRGIVANSSHHIDIENNILREIPSAAIRAQQSDYVNIIGNEVYHCTYWTTQGVGAITVSEATVTPAGDTYTGEKIFIKNNRVYENENRFVSWNPTKNFIQFEIDEGTGIFLTRNYMTYTHGKMVIANNISYKNGASGIVCHYTNDVTIEHNTVYGNGTTNDGPPGGIGVNTSTNVMIRNNIAYAKSNKWALGKVGGTLTNVTAEANIIYKDSGTPNVVNFFTSGYTITNPLLMNVATNDLSLTASSPAKNTGSTNATQTTDLMGNLRDATPDIGAYEYATPLPISLLDFNGFSTEGGNKLTWQTEEEINASHFELESSIDAQKFEKIADIKATGDGSAYSFMDKNTSNISYYRLKMVDKDDSFEYSKTITLIGKSKNTLTQIYPNPTDGHISIKTQAETEGVVQIDFINSMGQNMQTIIRNINMGDNDMKLDISTLPKGIYFVKMSQLNQLYEVIRIFKN
jgi:hypothetical protein